jgi:hypothetical protein
MLALMELDTIEFVLNKDDLHFFAAEVANGVLLFVF